MFMPNGAIAMMVVCWVGLRVSTAWAQAGSIAEEQVITTTAGEQVQAGVDSETQGDFASTGEKTADVKTVSSSASEGARPVRQNGIGIQIGERLFFPVYINEFLGDAWEYMQRGSYNVSTIGTPVLLMGVPVRVRGVIYPVPRFGIAPYGQVFIAPKYLILSGAVNRSAWVTGLDFSGGIAAFLKLNPEKRVSPRFGVSGAFHYSQVAISGDLGDMRLSGIGGGGDIFGGVDINLSRVTITIEIAVPIGTIGLNNRTGNLKANTDFDSLNDITPPKRFGLTGFEIREGVVFPF